MADTKPCLALALFRVIWLWDTFVDFEISIVPRLSRLEEEEGVSRKLGRPTLVVFQSLCIFNVLAAQHCTEYKFLIG